MLLLTDRVSESTHLERAMKGSAPCTVVALHRALSIPFSHNFIACDVEIGNEASVKMLGAALQHHRATPEIPVLFFTRDPSQLTVAQARAMGATAILPGNTPPAEIQAVVERLTAVSARPERGIRAPGPPIEQRASDAKSALVRLLESGRRNQPVPTEVLGQGGAIVLTAIKQANIRAWLDVVWKHDDATYQHCLLVAGLVAAFAMKLGLASAHQNLLSQAGLIHDIGKATIPHDILNKRGKLTAGETEVMRTHAAAGHAMLARQKGIDPNVLDIVRHHHEYLDGSGYPDRLRDQQISGFVRVVTICDIYAALIERRPYRAPAPAMQAYGVLLEMGNKLDTSLVKAFQTIVTQT